MSREGKRFDTSEAAMGNSDHGRILRGERIDVVEMIPF
jgi:hypothetical protein